MEELKKYEEARGYKSLSRASDEFYLSIDFEKFKSQKEILSLVQQNQEYFTLIEDENGEIEIESKLYDKPQRYFLNKDHIFGIGDSLIKVLDNDMVVSNISNLDLLNQINDDNIQGFKQYSEDLIFLSDYVDRDKKLKSGNCGKSHTARATRKRNRTKLKLELGTLDHDTGYPDYIPFTLANERVLIRPYKKTFGVWYWCSRTLMCEIKYTLDVKNQYGSWEGFYLRETGKHTSVIDISVRSGMLSYGFHLDMPVNYRGIDAWAKSPSTGYARIQCNTHLANPSPYLP